MAEEPVRRRTKATLADHVQHYDDLLTFLNAEIERRSKEKKDGIKALRSTRKMVTQLRKELPQILRSKSARAILSTRKSTGGLRSPWRVSEELASFLEIDPSEAISREEVTRAICVYVRLRDDETREEVLKWAHLNPKGKRNLQNPHDRKTIVPDAKLSKLLGYDRYRKEVKAGRVTRKSGEVIADDTLHYFSIQKLLNPHFVERVVVASAEEEGGDGGEEE